MYILRRGFPLKRMQSNRSLSIEFEHVHLVSLGGKHQTRMLKYTIFQLTISKVALRV